MHGDTEKIITSVNAFSSGSWLSCVASRPLRTVHLGTMLSLVGPLSSLQSPDM